MADSGINITEGLGQVVDSRTEGTNGNHRQVIVVGDPSTNAGVAPVDATNGLAVDVKTLPATTNTREVVGDVAQDAAIAGNPVSVGGRASAAEPTDMSADGDSVYSWMDRKGRQIVAFQSGTGTLSNVSGSASSVTVLAANTARKGATIVNDSTALLYLKFGSSASTSSYTVVLAGAASAPFAYYEVPFGYTGIITGIWASAAGNARVTEVT
jgi:hypothetical protein